MWDENITASFGLVISPATYYWSSTEYTYNSAVIQSGVEASALEDKNTSYHVRWIRSF